MSPPPTSNLAHSIQARLKNVAMESGRPFAELLELYAIERFLQRLGWALLFGAILAFASSRPDVTYACRCLISSDREASDRDALNRHELVFAGTVTGFRNQAPDEFGNFPQWWDVDLSVDHVWKGDVADATTIANTHGAACGFEDYEEGSRYLIFASSVWLEDLDRPFADLCSGTRRLDIDDNGMPITELGESHAPLSAVPTEQTQVAIAETPASEVDVAAEPVAVESVATESVAGEPMAAWPVAVDTSTGEAWNGWTLVMLALGLGAGFVIVERSRRRRASNGGDAE